VFRRDKAVELRCVQVCQGAASRGGLGVFGSGEVRLGTARRSRFGVLWRGPVRRGVVSRLTNKNKAGCDGLLYKQKLWRINLCLSFLKRLSSVS
jgi:hypothetical protein